MNKKTLIDNNTQFTSWNYATDYPQSQGVLLIVQFMERINNTTISLRKEFIDMTPEAARALAASLMKAANEYDKFEDSLARWCEEASHPAYDFAMWVRGQSWYETGGEQTPADIMMSTPEMGVVYIVATNENSPVKQVIMVERHAWRQIQHLKNPDSYNPRPEVDEELWTSTSYVRMDHRGRFEIFTPGEYETWANVPSYDGYIEAMMAAATK